MPGLTFTLNVKRTKAPIPNGEILLHQDHLPPNTPKIEAVAGYTGFTYKDSLLNMNARLGVLVTPALVSIPDLAPEPQNMYTVLSVTNPILGTAESWVAYGATDGIRLITPSQSARFLYTLHNHYSYLDGLSIDGSDPLFGRFAIESPDCEPSSMLCVARLAVAEFASDMLAASASLAA